MIPKYCSHCGHYSIEIRYDFILDRVYYCTRCRSEFYENYAQEVLANVLNDFCKFFSPIPGPCSYCGDPNHWRPDCPRIAEDNKIRVLKT